MSRLSNTIKNAKVGVVFHILFIIVQFFSRKIFLDGLGDTFIGTTATLQSFLGFLNLAELGIGTAIGFSLYKPIYDKNHHEINQIIQFVGNLYKKIGWIIVSVGVILSAFFPLIFSNSTIELWVIYYAFFSFLFSSIVGYFFNYHLFLLQADQKDFIIAKYFQSLNISKIVLQALAVYYFQSYLSWISLEIVTAIVYSILIRKKVGKEYPWLTLSLSKKEEKKEFQSYSVLLRKIKQLSVHKLGTFISGGTDNILIFYFINAQSVAFFGNYQLIILNVGMLVEKVFSGSNASVGNLVAENNIKSINQVLWELMSLRFFIGGVAFSCIMLLINPFITFWLGTSYLLDETIVFLFCLVFFIRQIVQPIEAFKQAYGLYSDTWAPIAEGLINLVVSIIFAKKYGLSGIILGTVVSIFLVVAVWRPIYVYRKGFKTPFKQYAEGFSKLLFFTVFSFLSLKYLFSDIISLNFTGILDFFISSALTITTTLTFYFLTMYLGTKYFRDLLNRLKEQFFKKI